MNTQVRDNFNETAPAKATGSGGYIVTTGANTVAQRSFATANVLTSETTTSTTYTDLTTSGPSVTATTGTQALVLWSCRIDNSTAGGFGVASIDVSGATTVAASDTIGILYESGNANDSSRAGVAHLFSLTAGSNTFKMQYRVSTGTGSFQNRRIQVVPL